MKSIRLTLTLTIWAATGALLLFATLGIFLATRQVLVSQFDDTLTAKTETIIIATEVDGRELELDFTVDDFAGFGLANGGDYFEVRRSDGKRVLASPSLGQDSLPNFTPPPPGAVEVHPGSLKDGRPARFLIRRFLPQDDERSRFTDLHIIVASQSTDLSRSLGVLATVLLITCVTAAAITGPVIRLALARGLRPLEHLGREVQNIDPALLDGRITEAGLPAELATVATRVNDLLARIEASFERERRFSSHAAHELRTPLAELKTLAEMGARWPDQASPDRCQEMLTVIDELEALLEKLSLLSRADSGRIILQPAAIDPTAFLAPLIERFQPAADARSLAFLVTTTPGPLHTDPVLLAALINNLVGNATAHAPSGSTIGIRLTTAELTVENPAPDLATTDLPHLFERFWRKDASHSGYGHSGLGLSIVQACAKVLGTTCSAELTTTGLLRFRIPLPTPPHVPAPTP